MLCNSLKLSSLAKFFGLPVSIAIEGVSLVVINAGVAK